MKCKKCNFKNVKESMTCRECGSPLTVETSIDRENYNNINVFSMFARGFEKIIESVLGAFKSGQTTGTARDDNVETSVPKLSFSNAVNLGFKKSFQFEGRSSRREYWWWILFARCVGLVVLIIDLLLPNTLSPSSVMVFGVVVLVLGLVIAIPTLAVSVRRLHDVGKTGWWIVPMEVVLSVTQFFLISGVYILYALLMEGDIAFPEGVPWIPYILIFGVVPLILTSLSILWWVDWLAEKGNSVANKYGSVPPEVVDR